MRDAGNQTMYKKQKLAKLKNKKRRQRLKDKARTQRTAAASR